MADFKTFLNATSSKATPVDADKVCIIDTEAANVTKHATWANIKAGIKTYYDAVTATLSNKTLTAPKIADGGFIADANGNELIVFQTTASAINELEVTNAAVGNPVGIAATGGDTDVSITITPKGAGTVNIAGSGAGILGLKDTDASHYLNITPGSNLTANRTLTITTGDAARTLTMGGNATISGKSTGVNVKSITVEDPTNAEDISMFFTTEAITVTKLAAVLTGSATPSVTWTVRHHTDRNNAGNEVVTSGTTTTSTTTGSIVTSFNDATIPADSFVWLETVAQSGTVDSITISITYTID